MPGAGDTKKSTGRGGSLHQPSQGPVLQHSCVAASLQRPGQHRCQQGESGDAGNDAQTIPHLPAATQNQGAERDLSPPHGQQGRKRGFSLNIALCPNTALFFFPLILENAQTFISILSQGMLVQLRGAVSVSEMLMAGQGPAGLLLPRELSEPGSAHAAPTGPQRCSGPQLGVALPHPSQLSLARGSRAVGPAGGAQEEPSFSLPFPALPERPGLAVQSPAFHSSGPT